MVLKAFSSDVKADNGTEAHWGWGVGDDRLIPAELAIASLGLALRATLVVGRASLRRSDHFAMLVGLSRSINLNVALGRLAIANALASLLKGGGSFSCAHARGSVSWCSSVAERDTGEIIFKLSDCSCQLNLVGRERGS